MGLPALEGIRILEAGVAWAVPCATKLLADFGAEVIKVESCTRLDTSRTGAYPHSRLGPRYWDEPSWYQTANPNKLGITLDLGQPRGAELFKELAKISDVVAENFSPRVMANFGLDYAALREVKPDIIMLSSTGFGHSGPWQNYIAYGWGLEQMSGISHLTGYADGPPVRSPIAYTDLPSALLGATAIMAALEYRRRTGKGQWIDLSQYEVGASTVVDALMDFIANGRVQARSGNDHAYYAPHGVYPCRGNDRWITIVVRNDAEWRQLRQAMGDPQWARDGRFADSLNRWHNRAALDRLLGEWTAGHDNLELMALLQGSGVPAGAALRNKEVLLNPQVKERDFYQVAESLTAGKRPYPGPWFKLSKTPGSIRRAAPNLGQDNHAVLKDLLGMTDAEVAALEREQIIGTEPIGDSAEVVALLRPLPREAQLALGVITEYDDDFEQILGLSD